MKKIFIVDDDSIYSKMLERTFVTENFEVELAIEGADALAKLYMMDIPPAAIILDIMIPVLSGVEVLKLIKQSDKLKSVPVVIVSNLNPEPESEKKIIALGAAAYLHKSKFTRQQITQKVVEIIDGSLVAKTVPDGKVVVKSKKLPPSLRV